jgi:hypothetical protein
LWDVAGEWFGEGVFGRRGRLFHEVLVLEGGFGIGESLEGLFVLYNLVFLSNLVFKVVVVGSNLSIVRQGTDIPPLILPDFTLPFILNPGQFLLPLPQSLPINHLPIIHLVVLR